jgi:hypothetical protein
LCFARFLNQGSEHFKDRAHRSVEAEVDIAVVAADGEDR